MPHAGYQYSGPFAAYAYARLRAAVRTRAAEQGHSDGVRRVVLIGVESTGKTTLAQKLAAEYETQWVAEYGREYWEKKVAGLPMDGPLPAFTDEEFVTIAVGQQRRPSRNPWRDRG